MAGLPGLLFANGHIYWNGAQVDNEMVRKKPIKILEYLFQNRGKFVSREALWNLLYSAQIDGGPDSKIFDVYLSRVRRLISIHQIPIRIETVTADYGDSCRGSGGYTLLVESP